MQTLDFSGQTRIRTLFISDLHLGARGCRASEILAFLERTQAEMIYLVGDIFDLWHGATIYWDERHDSILDLLLRRQAQGVKLAYIHGNHDAPNADPARRWVPEWTICERTTHVLADGQRMLVLHGDQCDGRLLKWSVMTRAGSLLDGTMRRIDGWLRRRLGRAEHERSLIQACIAAVNSVLSSGDGLADRLLALADQSGHDGVICGHFHRPALRESNGMTYANCGDWMDSLTALVETHDGTLQLLEWAPQSRTHSVALTQKALLC